MLSFENLLHMQRVPALDQDDECVGCGNVKTYNGKPASSLIACRQCFRRLPKWMREAFNRDHARPTIGTATIWQNRIAVALVWMRESDEENPEAEPRSQTTLNQGL